MNDGVLPPPRIRGTFDSEGRLIAGSAELTEWHQRSGGVEGEAIALPGVADLIRQSASAGVPMAHHLLLANDSHTATWWAQTVIVDDRVHLELVDSARVMQPAPDADEMERQRDFLRAGTDWLWEVDHELRITALSDSATRFFGCAPLMLVGRHFLEVLFETRATKGDVLGSALKTARSFSGIQAPIADRDPAARALLFQGEPVLGLGNVVIGMRGMATEVDLPEGGSMDHVVPALAAPTPAHLSIGEILRPPVEAIMAEAAVLKAQSLGPLRSSYVDYAQDISFAAQHLRGLVDDLFDVAKIDSGNLGLRVTSIDLAETVLRAISITAGRAAAAGTRVDVRNMGECRVVGDPHRIVQILVNLIDNAIKYGGKGVRIEIVMEQANRIVRLHVDDDGPGIPEPARDRVFVKFERLDPSMPNGTGLGLYISRELARAMGGDLSCGGAPMGGARFTLSLPIA